MSNALARASFALNCDRPTMIRPGRLQRDARGTPLGLPSDDLVSYRSRRSLGTRLISMASPIPIIVSMVRYRAYDQGVSSKSEENDAAYITSHLSCALQTEEMAREHRQ